MILKLVISLVLSGLIGFERETHDRPAGLRTHILVSVGSTLITLCSYSISQSVAGAIFDPGRVTAQIVTGVGFLGAGTIIHQGSMVRGLTTAASIWTVAGIGIAVGIGGDMFYLALAASVLVFATLTTVRNIEQNILSRHVERFISITVPGDRESLDQAIAMFSQHDARLRILSSRDTVDGTTQIMRLGLRPGRNFDQLLLSTELTASKDVISYIWE